MLRRPPLAPRPYHQLGSAPQLEAIHPLTLRTEALPPLGTHQVMQQVSRVTPQLPSQGGGQAPAAVQGTRAKALPAACKGLVLMAMGVALGLRAAVWKSPGAGRRELVGPGVCTPAEGV